MNWTISCNGTEKFLVDWGISQVTRRLISQGQDELVFKTDGTLCDSAPLFTPYGPWLTLWRDRTANGDGTFSGGTPWFQGIVVQVPRTGAPEAESMMYKVAGPWWYLEHMVFQQPYQNIFLGYATAGDPTSAPVYGQAYSSHLFLNQGLSGVALLKINTGQQIIEALNWALKPFIDAGATLPFQIGSVTPTVDVPIDEVRDITCAEVIHKMLRWSPDAVTWFDYTTTPPTFNCLRRADMQVNNLDVVSANVRQFSVNARYDLQAPSVQIFYETISNVNGQESLSLVKDFYPNPLPTDPAKQFASLQFTVDLQGLQASVTSAKITCDPMLPQDPDWWLGKHPEYAPYDPSDPADADNNIASFTIDANSLQRSPNPPTDSHGNPVTDLGFTTELTTGQLTDWMSFKSQRISLSVNATVTYRQGEVKPIILSYQCLSSNATSGTYTSQHVAAYPEPVPVGLAKFIFDAISVLQFQGSIVLQEQDVSGSLFIGQLFNLTGGALAEWSTMAAMIQGVTENIDKGTTNIQFGPPRQLNAGELVDLLRVNRLRLIRSSYSMRADGTPGDSSANVDLGQNTPEKNSVSGTAPPNPHVVSSTLDGSGAVIRHESFGEDCSSQWIGFPGSSGSAPAGSVTIALSDCAGQELKIQPIQLCLNGISGTMFFLCSQFVPDAD